MAEGDIQDLRARRAVAQMDRDQLEDKHLRLMEENLVLKKHARSQEEKMKRMATKLLRLTSDGKKEARRDGIPLAAVHFDQEKDEVIADVQRENRELEKQITSLKAKMSVLRQQLETRGKRHTPYDHIQSRISTGLNKKGPLKSVMADSDTMKMVSAAASNVGTQCANSCHNLLEEVRSDNQELEESVLQLQQRVAVLSAESQRSKEQLRAKSLRCEEEKLQLQEELQSQITALQTSNTDSEVQLLKLQRELRDKMNRLQTLQAKYLTAERNVDATKASHSRVLKELEILNGQLKEERRRNSQLQTELRSQSISQKANSELQEMIKDIRTEKELLKQANDRFVKSDSDRDQQQRLQIRTLQEQVKELQSTTQVDHLEKARVVKQLGNERELSDRLDGELRELRSTYLKLKEDFDKLQDKMSFFSKESSLDWREVEEALAVMRGNKEKRAGALSFLEEVEDSREDKPSSLEEQRLAHADTISELEKTRKLLQIQHTINNDYKKEVENLKSQVVEKEEAHSSQLREYAQLLDLRSARVKKLEGQLKDIAYGSRPYKIDTSRFEYVDGSGLEETIELERGQNLLQVSISQVLLTAEAVSHLHNTNPAVFVTLTFYDFETQVTPVVQGSSPLKEGRQQIQSSLIECPPPRKSLVKGERFIRSEGRPEPQFGFTSNFVVMVDDAFLSHLQKGVISIEVNQALGLKYQRLAVASVKLHELIVSGGGKIRGKVVLTGVDSMESCVNVGSLEYWMKLKQPVTQAIRLYQERNKALSLLDQQALSDKQPSPSHSTPRGPDYNEIMITMKSCHGLNPATSGHAPSAYIMYKFYTYPDHDTAIVSRSNDPQFSDNKLFPISMNHHLDAYLRTESLDVYVFDEEDTDESTYLGLAQVPLLPLAQGNVIDDKFQLTNASNAPVGYVELVLQWQHPYHVQVPTLMSKQEEKKQAPKTQLKSSVEPQPQPVVKPVTSMRTDIKPEVHQDIPESNVTSVTSELSESPPDHPLVAVEPVVRSQKLPPKLKPKAKTKSTVLARATKAKTKDSSVVLKNSLPPLQRVSAEPENINQVVLSPQLKAAVVSESEPEDSDVFQVTETEVSSMSGLQSDTNEQQPTTQQNLTPPFDIGDTQPTMLDEDNNTLRANEHPEVLVVKPPRHNADAVDYAAASEGSVSGEGDDITVVSETVGNLEDDEEEEIEEDIDDENTETEDTLFQEITDNDDEFSGLSEHSSDEQGTGGTNTIAITIESFTTEESSPLASSGDISNIFVEFQFLDYDYGELETPTSLPKPLPGQSAVFNFRKVLELDSEKEALLKSMLKPGDGRITFTVVSDPEDQDADCSDIGVAELDLNMILQRGEDINSESIDVYTVDDDDPEVVGFLNVSVEALDVIRRLVENT